MGKKKAGRPSWFKLFLNQKAMIDAVTDEAAGKALKAALHYFDTGEVADIEPLAGVVFAAMKPYIDEAFQDFQRSVDTGRSGAQKRWEKDGSPPIAPLYHPIGVSTEADAEADTDTDVEEEGDVDRVAKPTTRQRFTPPSVDEVRVYCKEQGYSVDAERFVNHYESNGWMVGKNKMKNWQAAVRNWVKRDKEAKEHGKTVSEFAELGKTIGVRL